VNNHAFSAARTRKLLKLPVLQPTFSAAMNPPAARPPLLFRPQPTLMVVAVVLGAALLLALAVWVMQEHRSVPLLRALDDPLQALRPSNPARTAPRLP
jgi:hypothetical protein